MTTTPHPTTDTLDTGDGLDPAVQATVATEPVPVVAEDDSERLRDIPTDTPTADALFGDGDLPRFKTRWDGVQAGFVDDPRECVQQADALVSEVVEHVTSALADTRSQLEHQWARGEEVSTEDLRVALKRYREFFQRLLAV